MKRVLESTQGETFDEVFAACDCDVDVLVRFMVQMSRMMALTLQVPIMQAGYPEESELVPVHFIVGIFEDAKLLRDMVSKLAEDTRNYDTFSAEGNGKNVVKLTHASVLKSREAKENK